MVFAFEPDSQASRHSPVQDRSQRTEARIVAAARALMAKHSFDSLSVAQVAGAARVSVGGFYRRFPRKEALAVFMAVDALSTDVVDAMMRQLSDARLAALPVREILRLYYANAAAAFVKHREVLRVAVGVARDEPESALGDHLRQVNRQLHGRLRAVVLARTDEITHPNPETAFDLGLLAMSAALREILLYGQPVSSLTTGGLSTIVDELAAAHHAMLAPANPGASRKAKRLPSARRKRGGA